MGFIKEKKIKRNDLIKYFCMSTNVWVCEKWVCKTNYNSFCACQEGFLDKCAWKKGLIKKKNTISTGDREAHYLKDSKNVKSKPDDLI